LIRQFSQRKLGSGLSATADGEIFGGGMSVQSSKASVAWIERQPNSQWTASQKERLGMLARGLQPKVMFDFIARCGCAYLGA
jgi:hypothetical protein